MKLNKYDEKSHPEEPSVGEDITKLEVDYW